MANIIRSLKSVRSELSKGKKVSCPDNPEASRKARKFDFIMLLTYLPYNRFHPYDMLVQLAVVWTRYPSGVV